MIKLGFQSAILGDLSFDEVITFASENSFACVELMCWPAGQSNRKYAGVTHIDVTTLDDNEIIRIKNKLQEKNVTISGLGYYPNPLDPDREKSDFYFNHIKKVIDASARLEIGIINTFIGADAAKHDDDNFSRFKELWPPIIRYAEEKKVKVCIENCPMFFTRDEWPSGNNLAHSPALWRKIFEASPSPNFGLNYDPSHLIWQMMDYVKPIHEFKDRIFHVHIKDAKVLWDKINDVGILTTPLQYHTPKLPGLGDIDWGSYFSALYEVGYDGYACIEVEDKSFEESLETRKISLIQSRNYLRQFITQ
jgi:sugar phosphate isomerase/epimerase